LQFPEIGSVFSTSGLPTPFGSLIPAAFATLNTVRRVGLPALAAAGALAGLDSRLFGRGELGLDQYVVVLRPTDISIFVA
jgi:hypothetical protein